MPEIPRDINLNFGIEWIVDSQDVDATTLPETRGYVPGDASVQDRLAEVLTPPTIEQTVLESFRPPLTIRDLLTPHGFQKAHRQCQQEVASHADDLRGTLDGDKVERLRGLLAEKADLTDLLTRFRQLLQQA